MPLQTLKHSPADIIGGLLIFLEVGTGPEDNDLWPVFVAGEPARPDNCITVYDTQGQDDGRAMVDGELIDHNGFQIMIRAKDHRTGYLKADEIRTALAKLTYNVSVYLDSSVYLVYCVTKIGQILCLGKESPTSKRSLFTINAMVPLETLY